MTLPDWHEEAISKARNRKSFDYGGVLLIIDAKSERAAQWYVNYGAEPLRHSPLTLVMPLATFAESLAQRGLL